MKSPDQLETENKYDTNPIPPGGGTKCSRKFNFLSSWQFLLSFSDFLGEFLIFILVLDFN